MRILVSGSTAEVLNLADRYQQHLGFILTPNNRNSPASLEETGLPWVADNGAFSGFDPDSFTRLLERCQGCQRCLWVVAPDVVGDSRRTLDLWPWWSLTIRGHGLSAAFVLQDGQEDLPLPDADAFFIGGSTDWKLSDSARDLAGEIKRRGIYLHMGRVNSLRRLRHAYDLGCDSVDGSGYSRFAAVARAKHRTDMLLERHLRFVFALERENQPLLY